MWFMLVTLDTSHLERSPSNDGAENNKPISVTAETSQDPIGPCGPSKQSEDSSRHSLIAAWSFALDFGTHPVTSYYTVEFRVDARIMVTFRAGSGFLLGVE